MKIDKVDFDFYEKESFNYYGYNIFVSKKYLESFNFFKNISFNSISSNGKILALFPVNERKIFFHKIFLTPQFTQFFNLIFKKNFKSEEEKFFTYRDIIYTYSNHLKKNYLYFSIPLSFDFFDMRFFIWNGIKTLPLYTYVLQNFKTNRDFENDPSFLEIYDVEGLFESFQLSYKGNMHIEKKNFIFLIKNLMEKKLLRIFSNSTAKIALLYDEQNKTAFTYIISGKETARLIEQIYSNGFLDGYTLDLSGANTERIAKYKSKLKPELKIYFKIEKSYVIG